MKAYLEPVDIELMERAASCLRDMLLIRLLFRLGCRVSEALSLKANDIDFDQGTVTILHSRSVSGYHVLSVRQVWAGDTSSVLYVVSRSLVL